MAEEVEWFTLELFFVGGIESVIPVSYTHLDVYKRQELDEKRVEAIPAGYVRRGGPKGRGYTSLFHIILTKIKANHFSNIYKRVGCKAS